MTPTLDKSTTIIELAERTISLDQSNSLSALIHHLLVAHICSNTSKAAMPSTDAAAAAEALPEKPSSPPSTGKENKKTNGAPSTPGPALLAATGEPAKLTGAELKAQKKAEKAAKRAQVIQSRQGGPVQAPSVAGSPITILSPQGSKASPRSGKEAGKGAHKRSGSTVSDSKNMPIRLAQQQQQHIAPVEPPVEDKTVELFRHLYKTRAKTVAGAKDVHPAVLALGQQMSSYVICGSNARLVATLQAFKRVRI